MHAQYNNQQQVYLGLVLRQKPGAKALCNADNVAKTSPNSPALQNEMPLPRHHNSDRAAGTLVSALSSLSTPAKSSSISSPNWQLGPPVTIRRIKQQNIYCQNQKIDPPALLSHPCNPLTFPIMRNPAQAGEQNSSHWRSSHMQIQKITQQTIHCKIRKHCSFHTSLTSAEPPTFLNNTGSFINSPAEE